jgi:hypothetical protein
VSHSTRTPGGSEERTLIARMTSPRLLIRMTSVLEDPANRESSDIDEDDRFFMRFDG